MSISVTKAIQSGRRKKLCSQALLLMAFLVFGDSFAVAATFAVNSVADARDSNAGDGICATSSGACSLRAAVEETNALSGSDTIDLPSGTYLITLGNGDDNAQRGDLDVTDNLTIVGSGQASTHVDGNAAARVFDIRKNASLRMSAVTIRNGNHNKQAGGIRVEGALLMTDVTIRNNNGKDGGGVSVRKAGSSLTLTNVTFMNNTADKGAGLHVKDSSNVTLSNTTFRENIAAKDGGGVFIDKAIVRVTASVFEGNSARKGGGLFAKGAVVNVSITNVTVSRNASSKEGGGIQMEGKGGIVRLVNVTVYGNSSPRGGGLRRKNGTLSLQNTIVANNFQGGDCDRAITSLGNNLDSDGSCQLGQAGDLPGIDPLLGPLQDNGGPTVTHALSGSSPALDAAANAGCPATDQRGISRPYDGNGDNVAVCDIGAFEAVALVPSFSLQNTVATLSDPILGGTNPKSIPGAIKLYTISLANNGPGRADADSIIFTDPLPPQTSLVVSDFDASNAGPVAFIDGTPASGLSYSFIDLSSTLDDVEFSNDNGVSYSYSPSAGADGSDPNVTHIRITPKGTAEFTGANPVVEFQLKVKVR